MCSAVQNWLELFATKATSRKKLTWKKNSVHSKGEIKIDYFLYNSYTIIQPCKLSMNYLLANLLFSWIMPSNDEWLSVDFWIFTSFFTVFACVCWEHWIVLHIQTSKQKQFFVSVLQTVSNLGKFSEINKQFHVKIWLTYQSYSSVWWILSCTFIIDTNPLWLV